MILFDHYSKNRLSFLIHLHLLNRSMLLMFLLVLQYPPIVTLPVGSSLTFATAEVAEDATLSSVPRVSV